MHPEPPPIRERTVLVEHPATPLVRESSRWERWWLVEIWKEHRGLFKSFVADLLLSGLLGGGLELFHLWATKSTALETKALVTIHYYGSVVVLALFGVGFAIDIVKFYYRKLSVGWGKEK
jgi:hypothetical protein